MNISIGRHKCQCEFRGQSAQFRAGSVSLHELSGRRFKSSRPDQYLHFYLKRFVGQFMGTFQIPRFVGISTASRVKIKGDDELQLAARW